MVGQGIHRMDECFTGQTALQKSLSASRSFRWESTSTLYKLYDYTEAVDAMKKNAADRPRIPCLLVSWDNSPVAPRRVSFSKTAIHSHSGEFWSGDCEIGRRLHRYPICFFSMAGTSRRKATTWSPTRGSGLDIWKNYAASAILWPGNSAGQKSWTTAIDLFPFELPPV